MEKIKKFFEKSVAVQVENFDYFLSDITNVLKVFGIDFWCADWRFRKASRLIIPVILVFLYAFVFEAIFLIDYRDDPYAIVKSLHLSIGSIMMLLKLTMAFWHRKTIIELLDVIKNEYWCFGEGDWLKKKILIAGSKKMKIFVRLYIGLFLMTIVICVTRPIIMVIFFAKFEAPLMLPAPGEKMKFIFLDSSIK